MRDMSDHSDAATKVEALSAELRQLDERRIAIGAELVDLQFGLDAEAKMAATTVMNDEYFGRLLALADEFKKDH